MEGRPKTEILELFRKVFVPTVIGFQDIKLFSISKTNASSIYHRVEICQLGFLSFFSEMSGVTATCGK